MIPSHAEANLRASGLACVRGERQLFADVTFALSNGGLLQVCGPNGSGKTSLLRMLCGFTPAARGEITWNGRRMASPDRAHLPGVAYVGHLNAIKDELDACENLRHSTRLAGWPADSEAAARALRWFGVGDLMHLPCRLLSPGQKRRVALARLQLSGACVLWIVDEPFSALDDGGIELTRALLESHLARGGLALLASHRPVSIAARTSTVIELGR